MKNVYFDVTSDKWIVDAQSVRDCLDNRGWTLENLFDIQEELFGEVISMKLLKNYNKLKGSKVL